MSIPRRSEGGAALVAATATALASVTGPNHGGPSGGVGATAIKREKEEEETLGQLRDRLAPGLARVPGPRAPFVHIKVEDSSSGDDTDGEGGGEGGEEATGGAGDREGLTEEEGEEEVDEEEKEVEAAEPVEQRAHAPGGRLIKSSREAVNPQSLKPGARSKPGFQRTPGRVADNAVQDNNDGEEEGVVPEHVLRRGVGRAGSSQFIGVSWIKNRNKWETRCKGTFTEEAAARAYNKYVKDGIDHVGHRGTSTSQFTGVCWSKQTNKWAAKCKGISCDGGGRMARVLQVPQGRHRSCQAPRCHQHLAVHGCLMGQERKQMGGEMQAHIPGPSRHGERSGACVQRRS